MRTGLLLTVFVLLAAPALAQIKGVPNAVAVPTPPLGSVTSSSGGCTPFNPCAVVTPALDDVAAPTPVVVPQPDQPAAAQTGTAPAPQAAGRGSQVQCPPLPGARGGRGAFAGRGGEGRGAFAGRGQQGRGGEGRGAFAGRGQFAGPGQAGRGMGAIPPECLPPNAGRGAGNPPAAGAR